MAPERLSQTLSKPRTLLSVYITAGYPFLDSTLPLCQMLEKNGVDLIEIGFPFSDPIADGPVIQESSAQALKNGMALKVLFKQLAGIRKSVSIPLLLMGYLNPVVQYGLERFCTDAKACGIDGLILPDAPLDWMQGQLGTLLKAHDLSWVPLVTPVTSEQRLRQYDNLASSFIYAVSMTGVTGAKLDVSKAQSTYLQRLESLKLKHPVLVGFGIDSPEAFKALTANAKGAIIGTAFIRALQSGGDYLEAGRAFIQRFKNT